METFSKNEEKNIARYLDGQPHDVKTMEVVVEKIGGGLMAIPEEAIHGIEDLLKSLKSKLVCEGYQKIRKRILKNKQLFFPEIFEPVFYTINYSTNIVHDEKFHQFVETSARELTGLCLEHAVKGNQRKFEKEVHKFCDRIHTSFRKGVLKES